MGLKIYDSKKQTKEDFVSLHEGEVRMYVCGPTVYDFLHVGNFRGVVFFNLVRNWLEKKGYKVDFVYNYTDVDDKIIQRAQKEGVDPHVISETYIKEFEKDFSSLKLQSHTHNPRVTEFMSSIIDLIQDLVANDKAYVVEGDVYFHVPSFASYGELSHKKLEDVLSGYRIEVDPRKRHPADFALWKSSKPGEPVWDSPWSKGRPGWHIECSAMARALLGDTIDIHGGGMDLIFPHHENERAQSEGATGRPFVKYWMHNNMLNFGSQKMSKSLGNIHSYRDFVTQYHPEIYKYMILSVHYRSITDFSESAIELAIGSLSKFYSALAWAEKLKKENFPLTPIPDSFQRALAKAQDQVVQALDDDFATPEVLAQWFEMLRLFNNLCRTSGPMKPEHKAVAEVFSSWLKNQGALMSLFQEKPQEFLRELDDRLLKKKGLDRTFIDQLIDERRQARLNKNFKRADEVRDQLKNLGLAVQDLGGETHWEVQK